MMVWSDTAYDWKTCCTWRQQQFVEQYMLVFVLASFVISKPAGFEILLECFLTEDEAKKTKKNDFEGSFN